MASSRGVGSLGTESEKAAVTNHMAQRTCQRQMLVSFPDPIGSSTLSLVDELGNGGFYTKLYPPPMESNCVYEGPFLPVHLSDNRYVCVGYYKKLAG